MPSTVPSASTAARSRWRCSREWLVACKCSQRSSIHLTGRPRRSAAAQTRYSSGVELAAHPEPAADLALVELHRGGRAAERGGHLVAVEMRPLGGAVEFEHVAPGIVDRDPRRGFPSAPRNAARPKPRFRPRRRRRRTPPRCRRATSPAHAPRSNALRRTGPAGRRRPGSAAGRDRFASTSSAASLGAIGAVGEHRRDRFADIAHPAAREDRLAVRARAP